MDDDRINKDFDDFLKKRYENYNIEPDKALWEGINSRLYQKKITTGLRKIRYLKVAVFSLAAIFAGTIIFFGIITRNGHTENQSVIKIAKTIQPFDTTNDNLLSVNNIQVEKADSIINTSTLVSDKTGSVSSGIKRVSCLKIKYGRILKFYPLKKKTLPLLIKSGMLIQLQKES